MENIKNAIIEYSKKINAQHSNGIITSSEYALIDSCLTRMLLDIDTTRESVKTVAEEMDVTMLVLQRLRDS